jgi:protein gp37
MGATKIEWTDRSDWNPVRGCTRVSPGCGGPGNHGGCYAEAMAARFSKPGMWGHGFAEMQSGKPRWTGKVELQEDRLTIPMSWTKPAKVFPNSTSDFFHEKLSADDRVRLFAVMALCPHLTFQLLTKRAELMRQWFADPDRADHVGLAMLTFVDRIPHGHRRVPWPLPNVWLGVSAERQQEADERIPHLLQTPAAIRFVSLEPLLGPIDLTVLRNGAGLGEGQRWLNALGVKGMDRGYVYEDLDTCSVPRIDWTIVGGESGPNARPMNPQWARDIRDQCKAAGVAYFHKQNGEFASVSEIEGDGRHFKFEDGRTVRRVGKKAAGRLLDGREHNAMPEARA